MVSLMRRFSRLVLLSLAIGCASVVSLAPPATAVVSDSWTVTGDPVQAPGYQTATVLSDGRVLAVGGQGTKAELFDPSTGRWSVAASMNIGRSYATATLLRTGQVLVAGGFDETNPLASAELYNPTSNRWTLTGGMNTGRLEHTATLLGNGTVLVAGGQVNTLTPWGYYQLPSATAEIYNPATGTFTPTAAMTKPRAIFTATLLRDGTVLTADNGTTDLYNPDTGQFSATASLPPDIDSYATVLLADGRVLSIGGVRGSTTAAEIYVPTTHTWQTAASLTAERFYAPFSAVLLADGRVLVTGGSNYEKSGDLWDPAAGFWTPTGPMFNARTSNFGLVRLTDGRVLVDGAAVPQVTCPSEGGSCTFGPVHPAEIYTP
jgi:hypothetical protein